MEMVSEQIYRPLVTKKGKGLTRIQIWVMWQICDRVMIFLINLRQGHDFFWQICDRVIFLTNLRQGHDFSDKFATGWWLFWQICDMIMIFSDKFATGSWFFDKFVTGSWFFLTNFRQGHDFSDKFATVSWLFLKKFATGFFWTGFAIGSLFFDWFYDGVMTMFRRSKIKLIKMSYANSESAKTFNTETVLEVFRNFFLFKDFQETLIIDILNYLLLFIILLICFPSTFFCSQFYSKYCFFFLFKILPCFCSISF